jgi:phenylalanyl-tRNA synthetase beta chain
MRAPLSWLRDFTDCALPVEEIARRLTAGGLEVEAIQRIGGFSRQVLVATVARVIDHPRGRGLRIAELELGGGRRATAVTGAPNIAAGSSGQKVAAALPGAILIDPKAAAFELFEVEPREVLGVSSNAVICSEKELGLADEHGGALILEPEAPEGRPLEEHRKPGPEAAADIVLDIAILPNYGRCLSIIGIARELAGLTRSSFRLHVEAEYLPLDPRAFAVTIAAPELCSRYSACAVLDVKVEPSPAWMQRRLALAGLKPINNLVDVTNYVMLELGQPMHAFDLDRLPAPAIEVRRARPAEAMHTLDQKPGEDGAMPPPHPLDPSLLLITSGGRAVAVAGVIGGRESQVFPETRAILLESANFDAIATRRAMMALRIATDSGVRFSREVDPALTVIAIQRAVRLLEEAGGYGAAGPIADVYARPAEARHIAVTAAEISRTLGVALGDGEIAAALERLGFTVSTEEGGRLDVRIPGFRTDVSIAADLAEEVIRAIGFDRLEPRLLDEPLPRQRRNVSWEMRKRLRAALVGCGLQEVLNYSLTTPEAERLLRAGGGQQGEDPPYVRIVNPSTQERSAMRRTLLAGVLECAARNHRLRPEGRLALFELGLVFHPEAGDGVQPRESLRLSIVLSGPVSEPTWRDPEPRQAGFHDLKGIVEALLAKLRVADAALAPAGGAPFHPGIAAELCIGGRPAGALGQLHPAVRDAYGFEGRAVLAAELELEPWIEASREQHPYRPFSRFPAVRQDLALVVGEEVSADQVSSAIREAAGPLLASIRLFDVYHGKQVGEGKKSLAFELTYSADDRSLLEEEVNALRDAMLPELEKRLGAKIR